MKYEYNRPYELKLSSECCIREEDLGKLVTQVLFRIGISVRHAGFFYIREGILICLMEDLPLVNVGKIIYPQIAQTHDTDGNKVERSIRHAIECCWARKKFNEAESLFDYTISSSSGKPTNAEFFAAVVDKLRMGLKM